MIEDDDTDGFVFLDELRLYFRQPTTRSTPLRLLPEGSSVARHEQRLLEEEDRGEPCAGRARSASASGRGLGSVDGMGMRNEEAGRSGSRAQPTRSRSRAVPAAPAPYGVVEGFSGPGGMSLGLHRAGFELLAAFDVDAKAVETHCKNLGARGFVADASVLTSAELLERAGVKAGDLDLFAGGPPCQGFSKQKRGAHLGDDRNVLVRHYLRLVREMRPRFFFFENVAIFGQKRGREYIREMFSTLRAATSARRSGTRCRRRSPKPSAERSSVAFEQPMGSARRCRTRARAPRNCRCSDGRRVVIEKVLHCH